MDEAGRRGKQTNRCLSLAGGMLFILSGLMSSMNAYSY